VRIVIGVYREPSEIATNNREEAKERLVKRVEELFDAGVYVNIGTHDHAFIHKIISMIKRKNIPTTRFEFQFLRGVQNAYAIELFLKEQGYTIRFYMPTEIHKFDGAPFMARRIVHNPDFMQHGIKNTFQKIWRVLRI